MEYRIDRRQLVRQGLVIGVVGAAAQALAQPGGTPIRSTTTPPPAPAGEPGKGVWPGFPQQDPALVKEMVGVSHGKIERVKELLAAHPELAKCSYDWSFGDWESALGAASHVGNRAIAKLLLEHGARLDIFAATMLGMTDVVKAMLTADPALAKTRGPHGISLVAHATAGKNDELAAYLKTFDGAGDDAYAPPTDEEQKGFLGTYKRDSSSQGGGDVVVGQNKFGMAVKAEGGPDRTLVRTGANTFHPIGAPHVRVLFTLDNGIAKRIEIVEGEWFVAATRA